MTGALAQNPAFVWGLIGAIVALGLAVVLLQSRRRRQPDLAPHIAPNISPRNVTAQVAALPVVSSADLANDVRAAEAEGAHETLPDLYLALAQSRISDGAAAEGEDLLRKILRSTGPRSRDSHAKARVLLGDMAQANGDLSTACEHWQMARALFYELDQKGDHASVEARMLKNGCPTDWVLTDF
jgi:hypothetical protein